MKVGHEYVPSTVPAHGLLPQVLSSTCNANCSVLAFSACNSACADWDDTSHVAHCSIPTMNFVHLYVGICMSNLQIYLRQLSSEVRYLEVVKSGKWIGVCDNLNVHKTVHDN